MRFRIFKDRQDAGRRLAEELQHVELTNPIVLGLPRGGVPVAYEVAVELHAPLDVMVVRKLGAPFQPELAIGAIASGNVRVLNEDWTSGLYGLDDSTVDQIAAKELKELERREMLYRADKPLPDLGQRDVVLVDEGLATGATMRAAVQAVRSRHPSKIIVAVPTGSEEAVRLISEVADSVICLETPEFFYAVGQSYVKFDQTTDTEVRHLLDSARRDSTATEEVRRE
jgi:putative phosphoribosyl transferase